jgi:hypothetical protein
MAQYNNNDQRNLEELLEEGWMDRLKARGAEALGSAKGVGQQIKGGFQQAAGSALTMAGKEKGKELSQQGQRSAGEGMVSGHNAKVQYLQKNIDKRIDSFVADIKNDIKKLGLDIGNIEIVSGINATPPPLPKQQASKPEPDEDEPENPVDYSYKKAIKKKPKAQPTANPRKGKVRKDPFAKYAAPEQEEDLDKMFWDR